MKKYLWIFIFFAVLAGGMLFVWNQNSKKQEQQSYTAEKTGTTVEQNEAVALSDNLNNEMVTEQELSEFSTKLPKDTKERYSNIDLACETLNGTVIKKGETFSLWNVLGCPTKEKGYRKAKTFTSTGKITKSYGGGICQVSTTIYNAVKEVKELAIKERHEHSRDVVYIQDGKDAAVSYQSADLKFKNTLDYDIKLEAKVEDNKVKITIVRI